MSHIEDQIYAHAISPTDLLSCRDLATQQGVLWSDLAFNWDDTDHRWCCYDLSTQTCIFVVQPDGTWVLAND